MQMNLTIAHCSENQLYPDLFWDIFSQCFIFYSSVKNEIWLIYQMS